MSWLDTASRSLFGPGFVLGEAVGVDAGLDDVFAEGEAVHDCDLAVHPIGSPEKITYIHYDELAVRPERA